MTAKELSAFLSRSVANGSNPEVLVQRGDGEPVSIASIKTVVEHREGAEIPVDEVVLRTASPRRDKQEGEKLRLAKDEARTKAANPATK